MNYYGYAGKILYVDLTRGQFWTEPLDMVMVKKYLGGCGIGQRLLYDLLKPGIDPLSPDNPLIISAGPLTGTLVPSSSKIQIITKSATPATKDQTKYYIGWSSGGSNRFGIMMKNAGYDQIVIIGKANRPVYLKIIDEDIEICNAENLWGCKDIFETTDELMKKYKNSGVIAIGKGGENLITFALGFVDKISSIGRNGGATIMGSKNLKAIVVYGTKGVKVHDPKILTKLSDSISQEQVEKAPEHDKLRSSALQPLEGEWRELYPPELAKITLAEMQGCAICPCACKGTYEIKDGEFAGTEFITNFFSHVQRYGRYMELKNYRHSMKLLSMLDQAGICYVTALAMIRFVTDLYEQGTIGKKDTGGIELKMGDMCTYMKLVEQIVNREGIGDAMARGWYALSEKIGVDEDTYRQSRGVIKGTSVIIGAEERTLPLLLETIVNPRGAMHQHPRFYFPNLPMDELKDWGTKLAMSKETIDRIFVNNDFNCGRFIKHVEDGEAVYFALGICLKGIGAMYENRSLKVIADLYEATTGIQISPEELKNTGERIWNLYKLLNIREGFDKTDDRCPGLWVKSMGGSIKTYVLGELKLKDYFNRPVTHAGLQKVLDDYYDERGWDLGRGIPTKNKLKELGLEEFVKVLEEWSSK
jgi:aldehyde:ferredoxin oxidoreductase